MECQYAYLRANVDYVLCRKEPVPNINDRTALFHAVCAHQAHCPKMKCHKLTSSWIKCVKLAESNQKAYESALPAEDQTVEEAPKKTTRRRRSAPAETDGE